MGDNKKDGQKPNPNLKRQETDNKTLSPEDLSPEDIKQLAKAISDALRRDLH